DSSSADLLAKPATAAGKLPVINKNTPLRLPPDTPTILAKTLERPASSSATSAAPHDKRDRPIAYAFTGHGNNLTMRTANVFRFFCTQLMFSKCLLPTGYSSSADLLAKPATAVGKLPVINKNTPLRLPPDTPTILTKTLERLASSSATSAAPHDKKDRPIAYAFTGHGNNLTMRTANVFRFFCTQLMFSKCLLPTGDSSSADLLAKPATAVGKLPVINKNTPLRLPPDTPTILTKTLERLASSSATSAAPHDKKDRPIAYAFTGHGNNLTMRTANVFCFFCTQLMFSKCLLPTGDSSSADLLAKHATAAGKLPVINKNTPLRLPPDTPTILAKTLERPASSSATSAAPHDKRDRPIAYAFTGHGNNLTMRTANVFRFFCTQLMFRKCLLPTRDSSSADLLAKPATAVGKLPVINKNTPLRLPPDTPTILTKTLERLASSSATSAAPHDKKDRPIAYAFTGHGNNLTMRTANVFRFFCTQLMFSKCLLPTGDSSSADLLAKPATAAGDSSSADLLAKPATAAGKLPVINKNTPLRLPPDTPTILTKTLERPASSSATSAVPHDKRDRPIAYAFTGHGNNHTMRTANVFRFFCTQLMFSKCLLPTVDSSSADLLAKPATAAGKLPVINKNTPLRLPPDTPTILTKTLERPASSSATSAAPHDKRDRPIAYAFTGHGNNHTMRTANVFRFFCTQLMFSECLLPTVDSSSADLLAKPATAAGKLPVINNKNTPLRLPPDTPTILTKTLERPASSSATSAAPHDKRGRPIAYAFTGHGNNHTMRTANVFPFFCTQLMFSKCLLPTVDSSSADLLAKPATAAGKLPVINKNTPLRLPPDTPTILTKTLERPASSSATSAAPHDKRDRPIAYAFTGHGNNHTMRTANVFRFFCTQLMFSKCLLPTVDSSSADLLAKPATAAGKLPVINKNTPLRLRPDTPTILTKTLERPASSSATSAAPQDKRDRPITYAFTGHGNNHTMRTANVFRFFCTQLMFSKCLLPTVDSSSADLLAKPATAAGKLPVINKNTPLRLPPDTPTILTKTLERPASSSATSAAPHDKRDRPIAYAFTGHGNNLTMRTANVFRFFCTQLMFSKCLLPTGDSSSADLLAKPATAAGKLPVINKNTPLRLPPDTPTILTKTLERLASSSATSAAPHDKRDRPIAYAFTGHGNNLTMRTANVFRFFCTQMMFSKCLLPTGDSSSADLLAKPATAAGKLPVINRDTPLRLPPDTPTILAKTLERPASSSATSAAPHDKRDRPIAYAFTGHGNNHTMRTANVFRFFCTQLMFSKCLLPTGDSSSADLLAKPATAAGDSSSADLLAKPATAAGKLPVIYKNTPLRLPPDTPTILAKTLERPASSSATSAAPHDKRDRPIAYAFTGHGNNHTMRTANVFRFFCTQLMISKCLLPTGYSSSADLLAKPATAAGKLPVINKNTPLRLPPDTPTILTKTLERPASSSATSAALHDKRDRPIAYAFTGHGNNLTMRTANVFRFFCTQLMFSKCLLPTGDSSSADLLAKPATAAGKLPVINKNTRPRLPPDTPTILTKTLERPASSSVTSAAPHDKRDRPIAYAFTGHGNNLTMRTANVFRFFCTQLMSSKCLLPTGYSNSADLLAKPATAAGKLPVINKNTPLRLPPDTPTILTKTLERPASSSATSAAPHDKRDRPIAYAFTGHGNNLTMRTAKVFRFFCTQLMFSKCLLPTGDSSSADLLAKPATAAGKLPVINKNTPLRLPPDTPTILAKTLERPASSSATSAAPHDKRDRPIAYAFTGHGNNHTMRTANVFRFFCTQLMISKCLLPTGDSSSADLLAKPATAAGKLPVINKNTPLRLPPDTPTILTKTLERPASSSATSAALHDKRDRPIAYAFTGHGNNLTMRTANVFRFFCTQLMFSKCLLPTGDSSSADLLAKPATAAGKLPVINKNTPLRLPPDTPTILTKKLKRPASSSATSAAPHDKRDRPIAYAFTGHMKNLTMRTANVFRFFCMQLMFSKCLLPTGDSSSADLLAKPATAAGKLPVINKNTPLRLPPDTPTILTKTLERPASSSATSAAPHDKRDRPIAYAFTGHGKNLTMRTANVFRFFCTQLMFSKCLLPTGDSSSADLLAKPATAAGKLPVINKNTPLRRARSRGQPHHQRHQRRHTIRGTGPSPTLSLGMGTTIRCGRLTFFASSVRSHLSDSGLNPPGFGGVFGQLD
ncbi:uncharacterized protein ISCGN_003024, partial [Ixodes scapularis]